VQQTPCLSGAFERERPDAVAYPSPARADCYAHPRHVLEGVRSLVVLALPYRTREPAPAAPGQGRVSRYAWGIDYHDLARRRLKQLAAWLHAQAGPCRVRGVVDTAPLLEREFAQLAGPRKKAIAAPAPPAWRRAPPRRSSLPGCWIAAAASVI